MDLSEVEGLSEGQVAAINAAHDSNVAGLKANHEKILTEKKAAQADFDSQKLVAEEARKSAVDAKEKQLLSEDKYEEAQKLREDERAASVAEANINADKYKGALDNFHLSTAKNGVLSKVAEGMEDFASAMLDKIVSVSYDDDGNPITSFKFGDKEFNSAAAFTDGVSEDAGWSRMLRGADSSGAGTKQSNTGSASSTGIDKTQSALEQRLKKQGL